MKKFLSVLMTIVLALTVLSGCEKNDGIKIGIIQFGSHSSLDNCRKGIEEALSSEFKKASIDVQNGSFDTATCDGIAKNMVSKGYDIIIPIATPAAMSAYAAARGSNIPVVFCAVSDPVAAGLAKSLDKPNENCTGTSDVLNLDAQTDLIRALQPDAKKIGVIYTTSEANSVSHLKTLEKIAAQKGFEVVSVGVQTAADIPQAAASLSSKADLINNFTDNNVVNNLQTVLEKAKNIPVYGSEIEQVTKGCIASESIDYVALGKKTGEIAARILNGEKTENIAISASDKTEPVVNPKILKCFNITLPKEYENAKQTGAEK